MGKVRLRNKLEMEVGKTLSFTHHATHDHAPLVHAVEDMSPDQVDDLTKVFANLDAQPRDADENAPGVIDTEIDEQLKIGDIPTEDRSRRVWAILRNVEGAGGGIAELAIADLGPAEQIMDILRRKTVTNYTYAASPRLVRGSRPSPQKLSDLFHHNRVKSTVNLCREMHHGDDEVVAAAGLTGRIRTLHIPIVDNGVPTPAQVVQFFEYLKDPDNLPAYVHCEQGVGRTGVMVACFRVGFNRWSPQDAKGEAQRFSNSMDMQLAFIEKFGGILSGEPQSQWTGAFNAAGFPNKNMETPISPPEPQVGREDCLDQTSQTEVSGPA